MQPCRECRHSISEQAFTCPNCGAPYPARKQWDGWGYEYKSGATLLGLPLLHISFKFRPNKMPVPAKGVFAIGQFATGIFTLAQFSIGVVSVSQFTIAFFALAQFAFAFKLIAQMGIYIDEGYGQIVKSLTELLAMIPV